MNADLLLRLELEVNAAAADRAAAVAWSLGAQGVELRDHATGETSAERCIVCSWHPATIDTDTLLTRARDRLGDGVVRLVPDDPRGWMASLDHPPLRVGRFEIRAASGAAPTDSTVLIEPGTAFGAGSHPTTALCVEAIERRMDHAPVGRVLDVGTGTGILALVAAMGGAEVVATDIDGLARAAARRHVKLNGLDGRVSVAEALPPRTPGFDLVVANLYVSPLLALAKDLADRVVSGGALVVSGIDEMHCPRIEAALALHGLRPTDRRVQDGWVASTLIRP